MKNMHFPREQDPRTPKYEEIENKQNNVFEEYIKIRLSVSNVFFIESTCSKSNVLKENQINSKMMTLNPRQACAVESAAITNPDRPIYILYTCPISDDFISYSPNFVKALFVYKNVKIVRLNAEKVFEHTMLRQLYETNRVERSDYPVETFSDLLRVAVLCRFGGTYLDLDTITIKSLNDLGSNYIGLESSKSINGAVINVEPFGDGHSLMKSVIQFISRNFDSKVWGANGPDALTCVILQKCGLKTINKAIHKCKAIHVLPQEVFYPVNFKEKDLLFNKAIGPQLVSKIKKSSYIVHFWNYLSHGIHVDVNSNQAYGLLASEFCPKVVDYVGSSVF
ncbi:lactosylceramide 4-alpha-galactosyltransferase-like [Macrosteles quadrilineatus]|uniref:lactosylceramide 4-alpha-galactosyltransferase-like n=1 Tax=Macrosteles quadrilineatus TaxID=74068 RepID=UPI0023E0A75E|nr:lactosylceramide 4-alpha-galactosyltransferase-like [Macrosteles quadrilineatus]